MSTTTEPHKTLFGIAEDLAAIQAALIEADGVLTPEMEQRLSEAADVLEDKVDAYGYRIGSLEAYASMHDDRAKFHALQATSYTRIAERLKALLLVAMQRLGTRKLVGTDYTATISDSKRTSIESPALIPQNDRYWRIKAPEINVEAIRKDLLDGVDVPGAKLETVPHVRLR